MKNIDKVNVFVAGVQKSGTTSLFKYLCGHSNLLPGYRKEIHFFDNETIDWKSPNYDTLHNSFVPHHKRNIAFDATPIYIFWPPSLQRIARYNQQAKLILIFRDPIERAWSHWRMESNRKTEYLPFNFAIRQGRWRLRGIEKLDPGWRVFSYVERGFYGQQVRRVFDHFPRENVLLLKSNELIANYRSLLHRIAQFLQISEFGEMPEIRCFAGERIEVGIRDEDVDFLRALYRNETEEFAKLASLSLEDWPSVNYNLTVV